MGYITTFSIYNDGLHLIEENPQEFANKIVEAASGTYKSWQPDAGYSSEISLGGFYNLIRVQKTRHSNESALYVHYGNCVTEVNPNYPYEFSTQNKFHRKLVGVLSQNLNNILDKMTPEDFYNSLVEDLGIIPKEKLPEEYHNKLLAQILNDELNESIKTYLGKFS
jgi:hypothetical protein